MQMNLVAGDSAAVLAPTLRNPDGTAIDLTGCTVRLFWRINNADAVVRTMVLDVDPTTGKVSYRFAAAELAVGVMVAEVEIARPFTVVVTGNTTNLSNVVTGLSSTTALLAGMTVTGAGIPGGATVSSVDSATQVTLSGVATATAAGVTLTFGGFRLLTQSQQYAIEIRPRVYGSARPT